MILIFSNTYDISTNEVTEWLDHFGRKWERVNGDQVSATSFSVSVSLETVAYPDSYCFLHPKQVGTVWFRRTESYRLPSLMAATEDDRRLDRSVSSFLKTEIDSAKSAAFSIFEGSFWLNHPSSTNPDKIFVLREAINAGLKIPATLVTNNRDDAREFIARYGKVITKPIRNVAFMIYNGSRHVPYTTRIRSEDLPATDELMFPMLLQEEIKRKADIRTFYLEGSFYTMAILPGRNSTSVDFREDSFVKPARRVSFELPKEVEKRLSHLMTRMEINSGSIDLLWDGGSDFYFLEVNPVGQFGMVSKSCNFPIEMAIARILCEKDNGK